jgi:SnoaL-like domain
MAVRSIPVDASARVNGTSAVTSAEFSVEDEREIHDLVVRYSDAVSRADAALLRNFWAEDCRLQLVGVNGFVKEISGRDTVVDYQEEHMDRYSSLLQLVGQGLVRARADGDAEGRWIVWEIGHTRGADHDRMGIVCYIDRYVRGGDRWLIAERRLSVHYHTEALASGAFAPLPALPPA